jgi:hypothetical protein
VERPGQPWTFPDLIARFDTSKFADGALTLRVQGFSVGADGTSLAPAATLIIDPSYGHLRLRIDNSPPVGRFNVNAFSLIPSPLPPPPFQPPAVHVCDIVNFDHEKLHLEFEASDANGHLKAYALAASFGHGQTVDPVPTTPDPGADTYASHIDPSRLWHGGTVKVEYDGTAYPASKMQSCAYQFRLDVTKRTTNGYSNIYSQADTVHLTLKRP